MLRLKNILFLKLSLIVILNALSFSLEARTENTAEAYIQQYKRIAISEMKKYGIPASIKLAQGLLESGIGQSRLATQANNHFGIKCHTTWNGQTIKHTDDAVDECFRVYTDPNQSYYDHSQFLVHRSRYSDLFKLKTNDYKGWAHGLKKAGYATNPRYAFMLIDVIERHQLYIYDMDLTHSEMEAYRNRITEKEKGTLAEIRKPEVKIETNNEIPLTTTTKSHYSTIFYNNRVRVIRQQRNETLKDISQRYDIPLFRLRSYNDLSTKQEVQAGGLIYLSRKKNRARKATHLVLSHESMWSISQDYGVKLSKLYKKNLLNIGEEPAEGATISLRRNSKIKPKLRSTKEIKDQKKDHIVDVSADQSEEISLQEDVVGTRIPAPKESKSLSNTIEVQKEEVGINYHPFNYHPNSSYRFNLIESSEGAFFYMVQQGDTLYNVSKRYNVSVEQLKEWNEMNGNDIQIQQQLIIYNQ